MFKIFMILIIVPLSGDPWVGALPLQQTYSTLDSCQQARKSKAEYVLNDYKNSELPEGKLYISSSCQDEKNTLRSEFIVKEFKKLWE